MDKFIIPLLLLYVVIMGAYVLSTADCPAGKTAVRGIFAFKCVTP